MGEEENRQFWLAKIISLHNNAGSQQSDRSRYLAASAAFQLGEIERKKFEAVTITIPLDKSITTKNNLLLAAQKRYTQAAQSDRKSTRLNSSHVRISYAVFCL